MPIKPLMRNLFFFFISIACIYFLLLCIQIKKILQIILCTICFCKIQTPGFNSQDAIIPRVERSWLRLIKLPFAACVYFTSEEDALVHGVRSRAEEVCRTSQSSAHGAAAGLRLRQTVVCASVKHQRLHREDQGKSLTAKDVAKEKGNIIVLIK